MPLGAPPRPVKRETISVWRAVVKFRKHELDAEGNGPLHTVYRLSERTHVVDGHQLTTRELLKRARGV